VRGEVCEDAPRARTDLTDGLIVASGCMPSFPQRCRA
jgi:hypothetical protein